MGAATQDRSGTSSPEGPVRLTVVGSGTMLPDGDRRSAAHYLEGAGGRILLDCGPGTLHSLESFGVPWERLTHLVLSHFHTDHIGDLPGLFFALEHGVRPPRSEPLTVLGPTGLYRRQAHMAGAFGDHLMEPGFRVELLEMGGAAEWSPPDGGFTLRCHPTPHTDVSLAWRWEGGGRTVGYTGDTAPSEEVAAFLTGCDVVITECAFPDPPPEGKHLSPASVAAMARVMEPELLLLTHVYPFQTPADAAREVRAGWDGRVEAARDGTTVVLGEGAPELRRPGTPDPQKGPD